AVLQPVFVVVGAVGAVELGGVQPRAHTAKAAAVGVARGVGAVDQAVAVVVEPVSTVGVGLDALGHPAVEVAAGVGRRAAAGHAVVAKPVAGPVGAAGVLAVGEPVAVVVRSVAAGGLGRLESPSRRRADAGGAR